MKICVVLPTKNEEKGIGTTIKEIKKLGYDIFVVDGNSTDKTAQIAKSLKVPVYLQKGKGKADGVMLAQNIAKKKGYDVIVLLDADGTYPPKYIPQLLKYMPQYDLVMGIRNFKNVPFIHRIGNLVHTWAINILFFKFFRDINTGMRAYNLKKLEIKNSKRFEVEAELTCKAAKKGLKIKEVMIDYKERLGESKIRLSDGWLILKRIIAERFTSS